VLPQCCFVDITQLADFTAACHLGVQHGCWYYEVIIDEMPAETATRIGWAQSLG